MARDFFLPAIKFKRVEAVVIEKITDHANRDPS